MRSVSGVPQKWWGPRASTTLAAALLAFATYFCMYAFRKPFTVGTYVSEQPLGVDLKTWFVSSQLIGYALSKYLGVRFVSEASRARRLPLLIGLVVASELALVGFALFPTPAKIACIFLNGLPLGMIWGLVVRSLEGRKATDFLLSALSCSFILASGVVKDAGRFLMSAVGVSEYWMPALTGALFLGPFCAFAALLDRIPEPDSEDVRLRAARPPMDARARRGFALRYWPGLGVLLAVYLVLTAYRDFRDSYGIELFAELGYGDQSALFAQTELPVAFFVLVTMASLGLIREQRRGLHAVFAIMIAGMLLIAGSTWALQNTWIDGAWWMIGVGLGCYLAYVPFSSFLFERLMAATRFSGTAVFAINLADAVGYTGSVVTQLYKDLLVPDTSRLQFFQRLSWELGIGGAALLGVAAVYFSARSVADAPAG